MRIFHKLILGFSAVILLTCLIGYLACINSKKILENSIGECSVGLAEGILDKIDRNIYGKIEIWKLFCTTSLRLKEAVLSSNQEFGKLDNIQEYIDGRNQEWISVPEELITPFMKEIIDNSISQALRKRIDFYSKEHGHKVFNEIFVTNKYGASIAQSGKTTDYYQADEEWWQLAKKDGLYVADVKYDRSTKLYSVTIGIRIDDELGNFVGVMKALLNIEEAIHTLTGLRGVGLWTAQWLLIRALGRDDGFPHDDLALCRVLGQLLNKGKPFQPEEAREYSSRWSPYRSYVTAYLFAAMQSGYAFPSV